MIAPVRAEARSCKAQGLLLLCSSAMSTSTDGLGAGGHIVHVASTLGQLDGIPLEGVKAYISGAKSVQELVDMTYPADEIAKVRTVGLHLYAAVWLMLLLLPGCESPSAVSVIGSHTADLHQHSRRPQMDSNSDDMGQKYLLYNITKAAVLHGTKLEAVDSTFTSRRITVAAICPGWCRVSVRYVR